MANADRPNGLRPVEHLNGNPWNGKYRVYYLDVTEGTDTFIGDPVEFAGSADSLGIYPSVNQAAVNETILGVVVGFGNTPQLTVDTSDLTRVYRPSSTAMYVAVCDDPDVIFEIQEDSDAETIEADDVGSVLDIIFTESGNTATGASGCELNSSDGGQTSGRQCKLLGLVPREDNALGDSAKWRVLIVEHEMRSVTGV